VAKTKFRVEVLTPEGEVFNDEVEMVSTRTGVGSIGVLAGHQPLLALLDPTELRLYRSDNDVERYAQGEGFLQVSKEGVLVLVDEIERPERLNPADLQERLRAAQDRLARADEGTEEQRQAQRDVRRYEAWLKVTA